MRRQTLITLCLHFLDKRTEEWRKVPLRIHHPRRGWEGKRTERDVDIALEEDAAKGCFIFKESQEELLSQPKMFPRGVISNHRHSLRAPPPNSQSIPLRHVSTLGTINSFYKSVSLFLSSLFIMPISNTI